MRNKHLLVFILAAGLSVSCEQVSTEGFETSLSNDTFTMLNAKALSCKMQIEDPSADNDLSPVTMNIGRIKIRWEGSSALRLEYIQIILEGAAIATKSQEFPLSGTDLAYVWKGSSGTVEITPSSSDQSSTGSCSWTLGGISISDKTKPAFGNGRMLFYGTTEENGRRVPVTSQQYFSWQYAGSGG